MRWLTCWRFARNSGVVHQSNWPDAIARRLGYKSYEDYLKSEHWKSVRETYESSGRSTKCMICGSSDYQLHHIRYDNLGREPLDDLRPLCKRHHTDVHHAHSFLRINLEDIDVAITAVTSEAWPFIDRRTFDNYWRSVSTVKKRRPMPNNDELWKAVEAEMASWS